MTPAEKLKESLREAGKALPEDEVEAHILRAMSMGWPSHKRVREYFGMLILGIEPDVKTPAEKLKDSVRERYKEMQPDSFDRLWRMAMLDGWPNHQRVARIFDDMAAVYKDTPQDDSGAPMLESIDEGPGSDQKLLAFGPSPRPVKNGAGKMMPWEGLTKGEQFGLFMAGYQARVGQPPKQCFVKVGSMYSGPAKSAGLHVSRIRSIDLHCVFFVLPA